MELDLGVPLIEDPGRLEKPRLSFVRRRSSQSGPCHRDDDREPGEEPLLKRGEFVQLVEVTQEAGRRLQIS
jgi:hypothetical protein